MALVIVGTACNLVRYSEIQTPSNKQDESFKLYSLKDGEEKQYCTYPLSIFWDIKDEN
jgi:hypothetical protein